MTERATTLTETGKRSFAWATKNAVKIGFVLALLCQALRSALPARYCDVCTQIAHFCTGDLP